jgi:S-adenosylmethionine synthetase
VQLSYAIGVPDPTSVLVNCEGLADGVSEKGIADAIRDIFPLKPREIISHLKLLRPIYRETAHDGHFGRRGKGFTWEKTDMVRPLRKALGL